MGAPTDLRDVLARFYRGELPKDELLRALATSGPLLVLGSSGQLVGIRLAGSPQAMVWTERDALQTFLDKGGAKIVVGGKPITQCIETWNRGFYVFHDFTAQLDCVVVNPLSGGSLGFSVERPDFARIRRLAKDALIADVLLAGPADPRFGRVLATHDAYRIVQLESGQLMTIGTSVPGIAAVVVFTSAESWQAFCAKNPPPPGAGFNVLTMDGAGLFSQLRDTVRAKAVAFDIASSHTVAVDERIFRLVLG